VLTRREVLVGAIAFGASMRARTAHAKASQPATPVNFKVPAGACDCLTHIYDDPKKFPFFGRCACTRFERFCRVGHDPPAVAEIRRYEVIWNSK
jgi:hypothetical protein